MNMKSVKCNIVNQENDEDVPFKRNLPGFRGIGSITETERIENKKGVNKVDKTQEADAKRQNALAEKWKILQDQKCAITNALKGESLNKKIKFDYDGVQQEHNENDLQSKKKKKLFDDDDASEHENKIELVPDYKLKLRFDGEKGKKLFNMQTIKSMGDDRFIMDKRFFDEQENTDKMSDNEVEKQMNILEDVVGRSVTKPHKNNEDELFNMVRYDPTQEDHKKYVKDKPELPKQKRPKKQKTEQSKVVIEPVVNTEKYYKVGNKLKDVFNTDNQFNLTSLFHTDKSNIEMNNEKCQIKKITKPQKKFGRNPFIDDSSDSENEDNNFEDNEKYVNSKIAEVPSEKILGPRGVWREVFFFKENDSRFKDAEEFYDPQYNKISYSGSQDSRFIKKRDILREFLKNKIKRHKRDIGKKMFSRKLGGTHNNQKSLTKQKHKLRKITNKFNGKKNGKSKKSK